MELNDVDLEEARGINFKEINRMRSHGEEMAKRLKAIGKLDPDAIAIELQALFAPDPMISNLSGPFLKNLWSKRSQAVIAFAKKNGLSTENVKDLLYLMAQLTGKISC